MYIYLLKSTTCLALLLGFYHLVLEREKMHHFNRFYLLGSLVFSLLVPFFTIYQTVPAVAETMNTVKQQEFLPIDGGTIETSIRQAPVDYTVYLMAFYILIALFLSFRFGKNLLNLWQKIIKNQHISYFMATVVLLKEKVLPHTFWHYIFIDKNQYNSQQLDAQVLTHELAHVSQKHTLDVLFVEVLRLVFWFNPIFSLYKKAIQLNHEFLADDKVLASHKNILAYQKLLLNLSSQSKTTYLTSNLNYSLTKKRIMMMTTPSSRTKILLKKLLILPLIIGFTFLFANKVVSQQKNKPQITEIKKTTNYISDKEMAEYKRLYTLVEQSKILKQQSVNRMRQLFDTMSLEQKKSVKNIYKLLPPPPPPSLLHQKTPTADQVKEWMNKEKYAIWIDGKAVDNAVLKNYKNTDFSYFSGSKVYKNARSKRFPQEYQFTLYTNSFFKKIKEKEAQEKASLHKDWYITINGQKYFYTFDKKERIARYYTADGKFANLDIVKEYNKKHAIFEKLKKTGKHYAFKTEVEQEKINQLYSDLGGMYFRMTRTDKNKVEYPKNPWGVYVRILRKDGSTYIKKRSELTEADKKLLPPPPPLALKPNASKAAIERYKEANAKREKDYKLYLERLNAWKKNRANNVPPPPKKIN